MLRWSTCRPALRPPRRLLRVDGRGHCGLRRLHRHDAAYERAIVFAPRDPDAFARDFERRSGIDCAVVDANDLEKAKVLGASGNVCAACVEGALLDNPHGNSDEQTPIVVLKWRGSGDQSAAKCRDGLRARMNATTLLFWALFGFAIAVPAGLALLLLTGRLGLRQHAYEDAPQTHQVKTGTPTMGGLVFVAALLAALVAGRVALLPELVALVVCCALIGFVDDMITVRGGSKRGLRARTKFLATALVAVIFLRAIDAGVAAFPTDTLFHAGTFALIAPHWLWLLLGILAITGTIHAVNLTDGLDGLATGSVIPPLIVFGLVAAQSNVPAAAIAAAAGVGACAAFLIFNRHPAKLFMGDTGSLALGALLGGAAILPARCCCSSSWAASSSPKRYR